MKEFTAKEARDMANKSRTVSRETRSILRSIKHAAKRGRYSLKLPYSEWDGVVVEGICENLKGLGYRACPDGWTSTIYVSWQGEGE